MKKQLIKLYSKHLLPFARPVARRLFGFCTNLSLLVFLQTQCVVVHGNPAVDFLRVFDASVHLKFSQQILPSVFYRVRYRDPNHSFLISLQQVQALTYPHLNEKLRRQAIFKQSPGDLEGSKIKIKSKRRSITFLPKSHSRFKTHFLQHCKAFIFCSNGLTQTFFSLLFLQYFLWLNFVDFIQLFLFGLLFVLTSNMFGNQPWPCVFAVIIRREVERERFPNASATTRRNFDNKLSPQNITSNQKDKQDSCILFCSLTVYSIKILKYCLYLNRKHVVTLLLSMDSLTILIEMPLTCNHLHHQT